jgi:hypothetical protein
MKIENIKFKAKSTLDGAWVQGDLIHKEDGKIAILRNGFNVSEVDPSTVCQFTGLKDCEGNEIWEGDMLSNVTNDSPDGIVMFKYGAFSLLAKNGRDFCVALTYLLSEKDSLNRFKVIGNKFDKEK